MSDTARPTDDKNDFTQGSIIKKLVPFMIPILGALILQAMYGAVDLMIVGRFGTTAGLSGVSTGSNVIYMVTMIITGLATGVTVLMGRYLGERHPEKIGSVLGGAIAMFAVIAVARCIALITLAHPIAVLMQSPKEAVDLTAQYLRICGGGIFFIIAYNVLSAVFRGLGDSRTPLIFVAVACCVNIVLDLVLVAGLDMNVAGAALATVTAQACSVCLALFMIIKKKSLPFTVSGKDIRFGPAIRLIIKIGSPLALQELLTQFSFLALVAFINRLGLNASSGYGVANKIFVFVMLIPTTLSQSMSSFVAQNAGAGKHRRANLAMVTGMGIGLSISVIAFLAVFFFGDVLSSIFTTDPAVIEQSWDYLRGVSAEAIACAVLFCLIGYFNGHQKTLFVMLQGLAQTFIVRLPLSWYMSIRPNASLTNIGLAAPIASVFGILINLTYFILYNRKIKQEQLSSDCQGRETSRKIL